MPVQVSYPGVYIQEVSSGSRTITGVSTSVALFVGMADEGPINTPIRIFSYSEFERNYGSANNSGELHDQVKQFFLNGGSTAWIMRVAKGALQAQVTLKAEDGSDVLELAAYDYGTVGTTIRAQVDYDTAEPESTFNLLVEQLGLDGGGTSVVVESELHKNLSMDPNSGRYVETVLEQASKLVRGTSLGGTAANAYSVWGIWEADGTTASNFISKLGGSDGQFRIIVDGGAPILITVPSSYTLRSEVKSLIENAVSAAGQSVTVSDFDLDISRHGWKIESGSAGGLVSFAPGDSNDISVSAQMGTANGGVDVGGWAHRRPAPSGIFGRLAVDTPATFKGRLDEWLALLANAISNVDVNDTIGTDTTTLSTTLPTTAAGSLLDLRATLDSLAAQVNANTSARWSAARHGYRLVFTPNYGDSTTDVTAYVDVNLGGGPDTTYFWDTGTGNAHYYQLGGFAATKGDFQNGDSNGSDGTTPDGDEYDAAYTIAEREIDIFNMLILPRSGDQNDADRALLWGSASAFCKTSRAVLIVDPDSTWATANEAVDPSTGVTSLRAGVATDHAALYWPRISVAASSGTKTIDPSGTMAGIMARTDAARGIWKAPAGLEASMLGVRGVEHAMSDAENGILNPQAVNAIRAFPNGIVSWGARTMVGFDNSGNDDYKYLPVRRLALYIEESLYRGLQWAVFEPNDEPLWGQLRNSAGSFMNNLFRLGAFAGAKKSDAYFVKVDRETTTQNDINLGIVNVVIGFAPLKPAEFVVITLQQKAGEVQT